MIQYGLSGLLPGDGGITQTVNKIIAAVRWVTANDYSVRKRAEYITSSCPERDQDCEVRSIFTWVLAHFRYVSDPKGLEMFKSPEVVDKEISANGVFAGDCDDVSGYLAALLSSFNYPVRFVTISLPNHGDAYRHIYLQVFMKKTKAWVTLEACARFMPMGFEAENGGRKALYPL